MAAAHNRISRLTVTRDMWGKSSRRKSTTNSRAVQHLPNHLACLLYTSDAADEL